MKIKRTFIYALTLLLLFPASFTQAISTDTIGIIIDGQVIRTDTEPIIINSRTLVPLRGIFEELDATVDWNKETRQAIVKNDQIEVLLAADSSEVLINGRLSHLDSPTTIIEDRLMIPLRFVAEALGHEVDWKPSTRDVLITRNPSPTMPADGTLPAVGDRTTLEHLLKYSNDLHQYIGGRFGLDMTLTEPAMEELRDSAFDTDDAGALAPDMEKSSAEADHSNTNNQVEGVDEGDLVDTNGEHIVIISGGKVKVIDPTPSNPTLLSEITVASGRGHVSNLYLTDDNQLVMIGSSYVSYGYPELFRLDEKMIAPPIYQTTNTFVLTYDINDAKEPELVMDMDFEGTYISSRLIDDHLYMVTEKGFNYWSIDQLTDYELQPKYADNLTGISTVVSFDEMRYFPDYVAPSVMMTVGIDLSTQETDVEAYLGSADTVYATTDHLYLALTHYEYASQLNTLIYVPNYTKTTSLYKFALDDGQVTYATKGSVPGSILNQFSLDAYDGNLRIATTTGEMWDENNLSNNNLYVLDANLKQIGELTDLAPGERIYSTRFHKERIYMVTYRQVDPFFVIDASTPAKPELLGYLKIPGFSTYMHVLDENHILGFGTETTEDEGFTRTGGLKLSLFDVTDPSEPVESKKEVIGVSGTYSEIQNNHKALMISLNKGLMGFPVSVAGKTPYAIDFVGAYVYDLTNSDFSYRGSVSHKEASSSPYNYQDNINRLIYIGDYLYSLSEGKMVVSKLADLSKVSELVFMDTTIYEVPVMVPLQ